MGRSANYLFLVALLGLGACNGPPPTVVNVPPAQAGVQGPPGPPGPAGAQGNEGSRGNAGNQGNQGNQGQSGDTGPVGNTGKPGDNTTVINMPPPTPQPTPAQTN